MHPKILISALVQTRLFSASIYIINTLYVINTSEHNPIQQLNSEDDKDDWEDQLFKVYIKMCEHYQILYIPIAIGKQFW